MPTKEQRIKDIREEIVFLMDDLIQIIQGNDILSKYEELALKIIRNRIKALEEELNELENR